MRGRVGVQHACMCVCARDGSGGVTGRVWCGGVVGVAGVVGGGRGVARVVLPGKLLPIMPTHRHIAVGVRPAPARMVAPAVPAR